MKNISLILLFFCASSITSYSMNLLVKKTTEKFVKSPAKAKFFSKRVDPACVTLVPIISLIPALVIYDQVSGLLKDHKDILWEKKKLVQLEWFEEPGYYER